MTTKITSDNISTTTLSALTDYYGFKNRIINGAMVIDARNAGANVTQTTTDTYTLDRWMCGGNVTSKFTVQQNAGSVTPPAGFKNYLGVTSSSAYSVGASDYYYVMQGIEGYNVADLGFGAAGASTITFSFWVRSSLTGSFGGAARNKISGADRSYPFTYTISAANTWEQKTVTVAGDVTGTWAANNSCSLTVCFGLGTGSTYSTTAGAWAAGNYIQPTSTVSVVGTNGATFYITGVQLEKGSTATSFDYRPYGTELVLCQRYCKVYKSSDSTNGYTRIGYGPAQSTTATIAPCPITTQMRTSPSVTTSGTFAVYDGVTLTDVTSIVVDSAQTPYLIFLALTVASGLTATRGYEIITKAGGNGVAIFSAEL